MTKDVGAVKWRSAPLADTGCVRRIVMGVAEKSRNLGPWLRTGRGTAGCGELKASTAAYRTMIQACPSATR